MMALASTTLEAAIIESPDWWEGAFVCYDRKLIIDLFNWYLEEEEKLKRKLKKNKVGAVLQSE